MVAGRGTSSNRAEIWLGSTTQRGAVARAPLVGEFRYSHSPTDSGVTALRRDGRSRAVSVGVPGRTGTLDAPDLSTVVRREAVGARPSGGDRHVGAEAGVDQ